MDWFRVLTILVAAATLSVTAEGAKKKIRIHLPQKIKHIHHHKKIYITNHPASSHYAPAYMPSAEGAMPVPTAVVSPPGFGPLELLEEPRMPGVAASHIVPLYRARGYYGPQPAEPEKDYDLVPPPETSHSSYISQPTGYAESNEVNPGKVKIVKVSNGSPRKKGPMRKPRSKQRVQTTSKPATPHHEDEVPVTNFHEQFYSDLDGSGTIKKIKRPHRVEKIIDGDTEHIHTYSEEHIHKLIYNDGSSAMAGHVQPLHFKAPSYMGYPSDGFGAVSGSLGTPSQLEYMSYNPREVTHDHVFHDHGEIPANLDIGREHMLLPPRVSYNSQGQLIRGGVESKNVKKYGQKFFKTPKVIANQASSDYSYYENMYSPYKNRAPKATNPTLYGPSIPSEQLIDNYQPSVDFRRHQNNKIRNAVPAGSPYYGHERPVTDFRQQVQQVQQVGTAPSGFGMTSTVVHDYKPKSYPNVVRPVIPQQPFTDSLNNFKDAVNYDFDTLGSNLPESIAADITNKPHSIYQGRKGKKKSFSRQNINFGGIGQQTQSYSSSGESINSHSAFDQVNDVLAAASTPYTIKASSPVYSYYSAMAEKALQQADPMVVGESSNDNFQFVAAPSTTTQAVVTTTSQFNYQDNDTDLIPTEAVEFIEVRPMESALKSKKEKMISVFDLPRKKNEKSMRSVSPSHHSSRFSFKQGPDTAQASGSLKYGDRI